MEKHKGKIIGALIAAVTPIYFYATLTNIFWPDLAWDERVWHQILGVMMMLIIFGIGMGSITDS